MTKLADIELDDLQADILNGNLTNWVRDKAVGMIAKKIVDEYFRQYGQEVCFGQSFRDDVRKRVLDTIADRIIDEWKDSNAD